MCTYAEIENVVLSNGKTVKQVNEDVSKEVERIYLEGWEKGISIPFWDKNGNIYLANPLCLLTQIMRDGSTKFLITRMAGFIRFLQMPSKH